MLVAADAAAQLVQVGQAVAIGLVDEHRVGVGDVEPAFDDRRGQQNVEPLGDEIEHHLFQFALGHLAVADAERRLGHDPLQLGGDDLDVVHAVVDEENLPAAIQLAQHGMADQRFVEPGDARFDRQPIFRRRFQIRNVAQAQERHVQRARDRRGGHRQHVDRLPQGLEPLFHLDAESLLLVDNHQAQIGERHVGLREPVRADDDIDRSGFQALDDLILLRPVQTAERRDLEREFGHPLGERAAMLLAENRGRHEHGHLIAGIDRFERGPHRHFRFAVADVAAQQPIHRPRCCMSCLMAAMAVSWSGVSR